MNLLHINATAVDQISIEELSQYEDAYFKINYCRMINKTNLKQKTISSNISFYFAEYNKICFNISIPINLNIKISNYYNIKGRMYEENEFPSNTIFQTYDNNIKCKVRFLYNDNYKIAQFLIKLENKLLPFNIELTDSLETEIYLEENFLRLKKYYRVDDIVLTTQL